RLKSLRSLRVASPREIDHNVLACRPLLGHTLPPIIPPRTSLHVTPDLDTIIGLFYASRAALGPFARVEPHEMPDVYRSLLAHEHHMTVTVEAYHGGPVDVRVLDRRITPTRYAREIVL